MLVRGSSGAADTWDRGSVDHPLHCPSSDLCSAGEFGRDAVILSSASGSSRKGIDGGACVMGDETARR